MFNFLVAGVKEREITIPRSTRGKNWKVIHGKGEKGENNLGELKFAARLRSSMFLKSHFLESGLMSRNLPSDNVIDPVAKRG